MGEKMPKICPICKGRGEMSRGFYLGVEIWDDNGTALEMCKTCGGSGLVL